MTTLSGHCFAHYEQGIRSKLTEYAGKNDVRVKNGSFKAVLNESLPDTVINDLIWNLENTWHVLSIRKT